MATLTLKSLPDRIHKKLKKRALQHHRSLNSEVIACLESSLENEKVDVNSLLAKAQKLRSQMGIRLKDKDLIQFKNQGRP